MSNVSPKQKDSWHGGVPEANIERMLELAKMPEARGKESVMVVAKSQRWRIGNHHSPRVVPSEINTMLNDTCVSACM
jgi:hypothetical protein